MRVLDRECARPAREGDLRDERGHLRRQVAPAACDDRYLALDVQQLVDVTPGNDASLIEDLHLVADGLYLGELVR